MEDTETANEHRKRCSTSFASREMQIKTTVRYYFMSIRMFIIKKEITKSIGEDVKQLEFSCITGDNVNGTASLKNSLAVPY